MFTRLWPHCVSVARCLGALGWEQLPQAWGGFQTPREMGEGVEGWEQSLS